MPHGQLPRMKDAKTVERSAHRIPSVFNLKKQITCGGFARVQHWPKHSVCATHSVLMMIRYSRYHNSPILQMYKLRLGGGSHVQAAGKVNPSTV